MKRRTVLVSLFGAAAVSGVVAFGFLGSGETLAETLSPKEAYDAVNAGEILLVDIRRPDEWQRTGIPDGAVPIDMRREDFVDIVRTQIASTGLPVAVICARGVRSRRVSDALVEAGIETVIDVPEGMLGSFAGPGWIKSGLPVEAWSG